MFGIEQPEESSQFTQTKAITLKTPAPRVNAENRGISLTVRRTQGIAASPAAVVARPGETYGRDLCNCGLLVVLSGFHEKRVWSKGFPLQAVHIHMHSILTSNSAPPRC
jgi:hypothetical protein